MKTKLSRILAVAMCASLFSVGGMTVTACGDDAPAAKKTKKSGKKRGRKKKKRGKGGKGGKLETYAKVADEYRHKFSERDFVPDVTGDENRDPFRSYVINNSGSRRQSDAPAIDVTEICTQDNSVASSYSLRHLRLIGIVLRGTKSYALFRDSGAFGHIVRRGDCLGKEKARVESIGAGFVRLTVIPEAPPGAPAPAPQTRDISLHPEEISLEPEDSEEAEE
jgi:hypothetical protein